MNSFAAILNTFVAIGTFLWSLHSHITTHGVIGKDFGGTRVDPFSLTLTVQRLQFVQIEIDNWFYSENST